ncbi:hypothetical protein MTR_4g097730 [Medicago truncatula]|uniref:Reverse transcriptase zinc-binding domain-containing protein n=1 Tax=Medicago truncatula TaxID=3880 RepID=G7JFA3_MEDTR|nr:hypothetical protein MTR_4g097730 [Medicago truncatula]
MATVVEMYSLGWEEEGEAWKWRRRLLAWEEGKVRECCDSSNKYNVTSAYNYLLSSTNNNLAADHITEIWNKEVQIIQPNAQVCVGGCGILEDAEHLFFSCDFFDKLWYDISHWLRFHIVFPKHVSDHLYQFGTLGGFSKSNRSAFNLIWLSCVWVIWIERNTRVFHQKEASFIQLLDKIKLQSYWWLKANCHTFAFSYHLWWLNHLPCLGIYL